MFKNQSGGLFGRLEKHFRVSSGPPDTLHRLQQEVESLRQIVLHLLHCQANGESADLNRKAIRSALYLSEEASTEEVLEKLRRTQAAVEGKQACPSCNSMVEIRTGVTPRCDFCGTEFVPIALRPLLLP